MTCWMPITKYWRKGIISAGYWAMQDGEAEGEAEAEAEAEAVTCAEVTAPEEG